MIEVKVNTEIKYSVLIGEGILNTLGLEIKKIKQPCKVMIVTDENVAPIYLDTVKESLTKSGYKPFEFIIKNGEQSKNAISYLSLIDACIDACLTREDILLSLGGGVVGDLTGFAASTYMRGISYINVPTTLLAMIDSSIGGKTAIDTEKGKNLIGTFWQPALVFIDTQTLRSLPQKEMLNGLGEGIKYALLTGGEIFYLLTLGDFFKHLSRFVFLCVSFKCDIVSADEKDKGIRGILNLGHTVGHAIEQLSKYKIPHGEAIVKGMDLILRSLLSTKKIQKKNYDSFTLLVNKFGFDVSISYSVKELIGVIVHDKKATQETKINLIEIASIGEPVINSISIEELEYFLNEGNSL